MFPFVIFLIGLFVGSFLHVVIYRLPKGKTILRGRSYCDSCKRSLTVVDLIPIFSFVFLGGKCRHCNAPIPLLYPLGELLTGTIFFFTAFTLASSGITLERLGGVYFFHLLPYLFVVSSFMVIFFIDLYHGIIPDVVVVTAAVVWLAYLLLTNLFLPNIVVSQASLLNSLFSAVAAFLFFLALFFITRGRGMGFGDVKFSALLGLFLGFPKIVMGLYAAFVIGAVVGVALVIIKRKTLKHTIPFGPFLVVGVLLAFFLGDFFLPLFSTLLS